MGDYERECRDVEWQFIRQYPEFDGWKFQQQFPDGDRVDLFKARLMAAAASARSIIPLATSAALVDVAAGAATAVGGGFTNINNFLGSKDNSDTLIGMNTANVWHITGPSSGDINGSFFFSGVEDLVGGTSSDNFVLQPGGIVGGTIIGGGGSNTIDYSNLSTPIVTNLEFDSTTLLAGGFNQIGTIIGSSDPSNELIGANQPEAWNISGPNSGSGHERISTV